MAIAYGGLGRFAPTCIGFRKAVCAGLIKIEDYSNYQMRLRFLGGAMGLPFMVSKSGLETDIVRLDGFPKEDRGKGKMPIKKLAIAQNPFGKENDKVVLLPALNPDVSIIHAQYVGEDGTVRIRGLTFADLEQANSASKFIVTCEEILPRSEIRRDPGQNSLSFLDRCRGKGAIVVFSLLSTPNISETWPAIVASVTVLTAFTCCGYLVYRHRRVPNGKSR